MALVAAITALVMMAVPESVAAIMAAASHAGAAWIEFAATAPAMAVAERVTPLFVKNSRSVSTPQVETDALPAHSVEQKLGPLLRGCSRCIRRRCLAVRG